MTLRFIDGFDHYATADLVAGLKWSTTGAATIETTAGRRGTSCAKYNGNSKYSSKTLDNQDVWIIGFAYQMVTPPGTGRILEFIDGTTVQCSLNIDATNHLVAMRGTSTTLATSTNTLVEDTWNYIEVKVTLSNSVGTFEVRVNGSNSGWINASSLDTCATANEYAAIIRIGAIAGGTAASQLFDDVYILDDNGSANNDFLGDVRVDAYPVDDNGALSQFVGNDSDSTDNYLLVDDATPDGDTTYVQSATVDNVDTYGHADMSHTPASIFGIQLVMDAKKDDSGDRSIAGVVRQGSTNYAGTAQVLSTSYIAYLDIRETDPATSVAWTKDGFNSCEIGHKVAA